MKSVAQILTPIFFALVIIAGILSRVNNPKLMPIKKNAFKIFLAATILGFVIFSGSCIACSTSREGTGEFYERDGVTRENTSVAGDIDLEKYSTIAFASFVISLGLGIVTLFLYGGVVEELEKKTKKKK
jgi:predicted permease